MPCKPIDCYMLALVFPSEQVVKCCVPFTPEVEAGNDITPKMTVFQCKSENHVFVGNTSARQVNNIVGIIRQQHILLYLTHTNTVAECPQIEVGQYCVYDCFNETNEMRQKC